eukprot:1888641-Prymnesium_polylepis.3
MGAAESSSSHCGSRCATSPGTPRVGYYSAGPLPPAPSLFPVATISEPPTGAQCRHRRELLNEQPGEPPRL